MRARSKAATTHIQTKHKLSEIDRETRQKLIDDGDLDDINRQILYLYYVKHKDFGFIADEIGLAPSTVYRRHCEAMRVMKRYLRR